MDSNIINIVSSVGFPIVITIYLLTKFETKIDKLSDSITELNTSIKQTLVEKK
ncbi:YvrJ family protein [uncultured Clostridium sp.]|uniref:YvrJ family protein n=1 Tax=uncultured Clostridium sp. TaxID=59620 RepID=UPI0025CBDC59|nr:YvrJ family protein [uncultured Clostridium sp.]